MCQMFGHPKRLESTGRGTQSEQSRGPSFVPVEFVLLEFVAGGLMDESVMLSFSRVSIRVGRQ